MLRAGMPSLALIVVRHWGAEMSMASSRWPAGAAGVETPAAAADPDLPDAGPLPGEPGAHRDAQFDGTGRGVGVARYYKRAGSRGGGGQDAPGHRLVTLGPAPVRADRPVEQ